MRVVSPLLKHVIYPGLSRSGYLRRLSSSAPAVVTYHGVLQHGYNVRDPVLDGHLVTPEAFVQQIQLFKKNYNIISPEQFLHWSEGVAELPRRSVLLTCDDGLRNTVTDMLPIAADLRVPFLFFITGTSADECSSMLWYEQMFLWLQAASAQGLMSISESQHRGKFLGLHALWICLVKQFSALERHTRKDALEDLRTRLGIPNNWETEYSQNEGLSRRFFVLNRTELKELRRAGMTIGAHTMSHPMLSQMSRENAFEEITESRVKLEGLIGEPVWALAYPFGNHVAVTKREEGLARDAGFKCAFMNIEGVSSSRFGFPRVHVSTAMCLAEVDAHVSGFHNSIRTLTRAAMPA